MAGRHATAPPRRHGHGAAPLAGAALALCLACQPASAAPKTDVVVLRNGDRITGEIKGLDRGILRFKTDGMGTLSIEWPHVARIETAQYLEVEQTDGNRSYGHATDPSADGSVVLGAEDSRETQSPLQMESIVRITPISEGSWLDHIDGHASLGLSAASANEDRQVTVSADMTYKAPRRSWTVTYEAARTESANNPVSERQDLNGIHRWFRSERWYWASTAGLTTNDELDLNLRSLIGAGLGRYWLQSSNRAFSTLGGLVFTSEAFEGEQRQENVEAMLQAQYEFFHFDNPDVDLSGQVTLFPSLTVSGRVRSELSLKARYELVKDLYFELSYIRSQDNQPPNDDAEQNDWSLTSSLGYKF